MILYAVNLWLKKSSLGSQGKRLSSNPNYVEDRQTDCLFNMHILICEIALPMKEIQFASCYIMNLLTLFYFIYLYFQSLEVVSRYRDTQLQVTENLCYLRNLSPNIYQCFKIEGIFFLTTCYQGLYSC